ncbi:hypothetical protein TSMEX_004116 [Taenia solium]|eukprot:TsM_000435800 transcript=TsM_000435800 gene=TsM_000435800
MLLTKCFEVRELWPRLNNTVLPNETSRQVKIVLEVGKSQIGMSKRFVWSPILGSQ